MNDPTSRTPCLAQPLPFTPGLPDLEPADLYRLGRRPYEETWRMQRVWLEERLGNRRRDALVLVEHDPVFTVGRRGQEEHWRRHWSRIQAAGIPLHHVDRGGSVTYHGPGQLVGYPIMRLRAAYPGPRRFVWMIEETLIRTLAHWNLGGIRREGLHGVWIELPGGPRKIAAVGIRIVRGVTMYGFALNVSLDLRPFEWIVPCGIGDCLITSMSALLGTSASCEDVGSVLASHFAKVFELSWSELAPLDHLAPTPEDVTHVERT